MTNSSSPQRFKLVTLGCRTNQYESQAYRDQLLAKGYLPANEGDEVDLCIVNTCTVTEAADKSSRQEIRQLAKKHPGVRLVVTGCAAEHHAEAIRQIPGVTDVVSNKDKERLLPLLYHDEEWPEFSIQRFEAHTRAFLKVQDGCNSFCSYCILPYVRGRSRSRSLDDIVEEAKVILAHGHREIVLTGINIGDFDGGVPRGTPKVRLAELVQAVDALEGLDRLRISSIDPDEVDDELADVVLNGKHTCKSMHLVLQSGSNVVLKAMNRKYTRQIFLDTVERLTEACPTFTVTTDVIVGFPGETEEDHRETLEVMRRVRFAKVHMFPFSPRDGTRAANFPNHVAPEVMQRRKQEVLRLAEQLAFELRQEYVGTWAQVLTESRDASRGARGAICGHTDNFLAVWIEDGELLPNTLVDVQLISNGADGLVGAVAVPAPEQLRRAL